MKTTGSRLAGQAGRLIVRFAIVLAGLTACIPAWAEDAPPPPRLVFADETAVTASPDKDGKFKLDFTVKNAGGNADTKGNPGEGMLKLNHQLGKKCDKVEAVDVPVQLQSNAVKVVQLEITKAELPATCYVELSMTGTAGNTSLRQVKLTQEYVTSAVWIPLAVCLVGALLVATGTGLYFGGRSLKFGPPAWEFAKSWASTTTFAGGAFTTAVAFSVLPELTKYASKAGYAILSLLISLLVVVAPFVFSGLRDGEIRWDEKNRQYAVTYRGEFVFFALSCALTLFAALAQLIVVFVVYREMFPDVDPWSLDCPLFVLAILVLLLCLYAGLSIKLTVQLQQKEKTQAQDRSAEQIQRLQVRRERLTNLGINANDLIREINANALLGEDMETGVQRPLPWPVL
jgi:hypothetical protein